MTKGQRHAKWARKIEAQRNSGLNIRKWCEQQSINEKTFSRWRRILKTEKRSKPTPPEGWCQVQPKAPVSNPTGFKLVLDDQITILLEAGYDRQLLQKILAAICP